MARSAFLDRHHPLPFAHRGGTESAPENSVAAFEAASRLGFSHLETDVHLTADGVLIAFHDDQLDRVTDGTGEIESLPWSTVSEARIGGTEPIPTLDELLERFPDRFWNIDAKSDHVVVALVEAIQRHDAYDRVCVASFSDDRLRRARSLLGRRVATAAGPREIASLTASVRLGRSGRSGSVAFDCVQVPVRHRNVELVTRSFVEGVHARGGQVHVWTIDDPDEMHRLLDLGVDGIMTDRPSVLRSVLIERDQWD